MDNIVKKIIDVTNPGSGSTTYSIAANDLPRTICAPHTIVIKHHPLLSFIIDDTGLTGTVKFEFSNNAGAEDPDWNTPTWFYDSTADVALTGTAVKSKTFVDCCFLYCRVSYVQTNSAGTGRLKIFLGSKGLI